MEHSANFYYSFNDSLYFAGIMLTPANGTAFQLRGVFVARRRMNRRIEDTIAAEFGNGGALFSGFLEDVLLSTRILEVWRQLNPTHKNHIDPHIVFVFRLFCVHASFFNKFWRARHGEHTAKCQKRTSRVVVWEACQEAIGRSRVRLGYTTPFAIGILARRRSLYGLRNQFRRQTRFWSLGDGHRGFTGGLDGEHG
jgi:hypothetical protein